MRILLVEDEEKLAQATARSLKAEGFAIDLALNGIDGMEMVATCAYDLIILDIMLPGLDGSQLLQEIRAHNRETPVLMLTAKSLFMIF